MSKAHDKLRVWGSDVDEGTRAQARRATRLPFVPGHVALMPDAHVGTGTYIVRGKGNPASYNSSSHGAGRRLSRGQAKRDLDPEGLRTAMKGKTWNASAARALVDEDPRAYKDIRKVMADQSDLTAVVYVLHQVLNYKGTSG